MGNSNNKVEPKKVKESEFKTYVELIIIKIGQQKQKKIKDIQNKRKEIGNLLQSNQLDLAKLKMTNIITNEKIIVAFDILTTVYEVMKEKVTSFLYNDQCPEDLRATLDTIVYCADQIDIKEMQKIKEAAQIKYGSLYVSNAKNNIDNLVSVNIIKNLKLENIPNNILINRLKQIVIEDKIDYFFPPEYDVGSGTDKGGDGGDSQNFFPNVSENFGNDNSKIQNNYSNLDGSSNTGGFNSNFNPDITNPYQQGMINNPYSQMGQMSQMGGNYMVHPSTFGGNMNMNPNMQQSQFGTNFNNFNQSQFNNVNPSQMNNFNNVNPSQFGHQNPSQFNQFGPSQFSNMNDNQFGNQNQSQFNTMNNNQFGNQNQSQFNNINSNQSQFNNNQFGNQNPSQITKSIIDPKNNNFSNNFNHSDPQSNEKPLNNNKDIQVSNNFNNNFNNQSNINNPSNFQNTNPSSFPNNNPSSFPNTNPSNFQQTSQFNNNNNNDFQNTNKSEYKLMSQFPSNSIISSNNIQNKPDSDNNNGPFVNPTVCNQSNFNLLQSNNYNNVDNMKVIPPNNTDSLKQDLKNNNQMLDNMQISQSVIINNDDIVNNKNNQFNNNTVSSSNDRCDVNYNQSQFQNYNPSTFNYNEFSNNYTQNQNTGVGNGVSMKFYQPDTNNENPYMNIGSSMNFFGNQSNINKSVNNNVVNQENTESKPQNDGKPGNDDMDFP